MKRRKTYWTVAAGAALWLALPFAALAQTPEDGLRVQELAATPGSLSITQGESATLQVVALDADGNEVNAMIRLVGPRTGVAVDPQSGEITGTSPGSFQVVATVVLPPDSEQDPPTLQVPVEVGWPAIAETVVEAPDFTLYEGTTIEHEARGFHADGSERPSELLDVRWSSSDPDVAAVDRFGAVTAVGQGTVTISASADGAEASVQYDVQAFPDARLELVSEMSEARTGDVLEFGARVVDASGDEVADLPVTWSYSFRSFDGVRQPGATGLVEEGRFVAEHPGRYTVMASAGPLSDRTTVEVEARQVVQRVDLQGQGRVNNVHTSDLWVFEGVDGRDYAISGTWGADGWAYMWDVTDPANMVKTDSIQVDARTVNDVKVSPDARYATMTREGASTRVNGLVILDLQDPAHPVIAAEFDDGLTGGVHNAFPMEDYVYTLSAGEKYLIIDVTDIYNPRAVGEVQHEDCRIHDVWVKDGLAYSAQWGCGIIVYDVGNGQWGGTPENPVYVSSLETPGGRTHGVFPYVQESTGRLLVFAGDEIMNRGGRALEGGLSTEPYDPDVPGSGLPSNTAGYLHILDFTDMENPRKIARYKVPEYGTHNSWVEDDVLYQAYYEGGLRMVDVSGELMGDLHKQEREIAVYKSNDPAGYIANAPMVWSGMPHKGRIFFSDWNSGMWSIELEPRQPLAM